jgi:hypothetical protein
MHRIAILALFCLLPGVVLAQDPPPDAPVAAPPLVPAPEAVEPEEPANPGPRAAPAVEKEETVHPVPRIILETLAGGAGTFTGGVVGGIVGLVLSGDCGIVEGNCSTTAIFALSGMALGTAGSTYLAGRFMNARGGFLGTLIGAVLGAGAGALLASGDETVGIIALLTLPAVGAMAGYELSGHLDDPARFSLTVTHESPALVPVIGTTPRGGFMGGLSGRF